MKKLIAVSLLLVSSFAVAKNVIYEYTAKDGKVYHTYAMPRGLTADEQALVKVYNIGESDKFLKDNQIITEHRNLLKEALLADLVVVQPDPDPVVWTDEMCQEDGWDRANGQGTACINDPVTDPDQTPVGLLDGKRECGTEWHWCNFDGTDVETRQVWFGDATKLSPPLTVQDTGVQCNEENFTTEDLPGNKCYILDDGATQPDPDPEPETCPEGKEGTPPNCTDIVVSPDPETCPAGTMGTPPNCVPHNMSNMPYVDVTKNMIPAIGYSSLRVQPVPDPTNENFIPSDFSFTGGDFRIHCAAAKMGNFDPIVFPGIDNSAHHHTFFGNVGVNPHSTPKTLKETGNSTCQGGIANRSSYWLPTPINTTDGTPLEPDWALFYYKGGDVKPPNGLMMIAGDQTATKDKPQGRDHINWQCNADKLGGVAYENRTNYIPDCSGDLTAVVHFPSCWDGKNLDSANHKSHMAYDNNGVCPSTHPKSLPDISGIIHYGVNGTKNLRLSSDNYEGGRGGYSLHMDYVFGWNDDVLDTWWKNCNLPNKDCHSDLLGDGTWLY